MNTSNVSNDYQDSKLTTRKNSWSIVIGADYCHTCLDKALTTLSMYGLVYYGILHDKDSNENGELKYNHYHIVISSSKRPTCKSILNQICSAFGCDINNVSALGIDNIIASVQYLIHKNDFMKYRYPISSVFTNDKFSNVEEIMDIKLFQDTLTPKSLLLLIRDSNTKLDLILKIGLSNYQHYRFTIMDIAQELEKGWYK